MQQGDARSITDLGVTAGGAGEPETVAGERDGGRSGDTEEAQYLGTGH